MNHMKNLIVAISIFAVMLGGIIAIDLNMDKNITSIMKMCDELIESVDNEDWEKIQDTYNKINSKWTDYRYVLFLLLNHADIDNVDFTMTELSSMIEQQEIPHVKNYAENLKFYFDELLDTEIISWENIL